MLRYGGAALQLFGGAGVFASLAMARAAAVDGTTDADWSTVLLLLATGSAFLAAGRGLRRRRPERGSREG